MIKSRGPNGTVSVTFTLAVAVGANHAAVCGEWNEWSAEPDIMAPTEDGFTHTVRLQAGRAYRFRYLLDGHRWENDWAADAYVPNDHGGDDSVVDLTALAEAVPAATAPVEARPAAVDKATPAKKATPVKKTTAAKKAAPVKKAQSARSAEPTKKAAPAKKAEPTKKAAPAKKTTKKALD